MYSDKTPDDGQRNCPKHVEFPSKINFEKLVHLIGFIIRELCSVICEGIRKVKTQQLIKYKEVAVEEVAVSFSGCVYSISIAPCSVPLPTQSFVILPVCTLRLHSDRDFYWLCGRNVSCP
jgi:hypothetical protein